MGSRGLKTNSLNKRSKTKSESDYSAKTPYVYHATTGPALKGIYERGLQPRRGMLGRGVYFAPTEQDALDWTESSTGGKVLLRVKSDYINKRGYQEMDDTQGISVKSVPSKQIEIKRGDNWISLEEYAKKRWRSFGLRPT